MATKVLKKKDDYKNILEYFSNRKIPLVISFFYVGVGTLSVCSVYPSDPLSGLWTMFGLALTFPACVVSLLYRYTETGPLYPVFIIQGVVFVLTFFFLVFLFKKTWPSAVRKLM